jgi:hypothetical protein
MTQDSRKDEWLADLKAWANVDEKLERIESSIEETNHHLYKLRQSLFILTILIVVAVLALFFAALTFPLPKVI